MTRRLGKHPPRHDRRTIQASDVLVRSAVPASPPARTWGDALGAIDILGNDLVGNCQIVAVLHVLQLAAAELGIPVPAFTAAQAIALYTKLTGYDGTPSTDNGAPMLDALNLLVREGLIAGYVKIDHTDQELVRLALNVFGPIYVGAELPTSAQATGAPWYGSAADVLTGANLPGSWGGHAMAAYRADRTGPGFATWQVRQPANWLWWSDYTDEAYGLILKPWVDGTHPAPNGLDLTAFNAAIAAIGAAL